MGAKLLTAVEDSATLMLFLVKDLHWDVSTRIGFRSTEFELPAFPCFDMEMLAVFMALPVILTSEPLWAMRPGAAVGAGMSFVVFTRQMVLSALDSS